jgi:cell wall-associated NlpC family hydrolase
VTPYFSTPERIDALRAAIKALEGTPFMSNGIATGPGGGIACQMLITSALIAAGFNTPPAPYGPANHWKFSSRSLVVEYLATRPEFVAVDLEKEPMPGDIIGFLMGKCIHHAGLYAGDFKFFHVMPHLPATLSTLRDPTWGTRLAAIWRPIEV